MSKYDIVVIGGGHNGLTAAAYLAKAGLSVCLVERQKMVGGTCATRELKLPGFRHEVGAYMHGVIQANPMIRLDELGLKSKYGLKYLTPDKQFESVFPDGRKLSFYRDIDKTCQSIAAFSQHDAEAYRKAFKVYSDMLKVASVAVFTPVPKWGAMMAFLDASEQGREYIKTVLSSAADLADEWFESAEVKVAVTRAASEMMVSPYEKGTGNAMFFIPSLHIGGFGLPEGGSGSLSNALAACFKGYGGTIMVSSQVKSISVTSGEARSIILESGEEISATRAIVSNLNARQLFLDLLNPQLLPEGFREKVKQIKLSAFSSMLLNVSTNKAPSFKDGHPMDSWFIEFNPFSSDLARTFDEFTYGLPSTCMPMMGVPSMFDSKRAPEGKHTCYIGHYEPGNLQNGGVDHWDKIKEEIAEGILAEVRKHIDGLDSANILEMNIFTPLDIQRYNPSMPEGDVMHMASSIRQYFANRPLPGWGQYRTPVKKLYMCGSSTHPGGGITGGGRAAALAIMEDLAIDYRKVTGN
ncbi:MAG: NAD(P)/FAD-dependent oxidoreductase [Dehalococcoidia bacterium]|jgi:phytoene dehydrogenase-like protein